MQRLPVLPLLLLAAIAASPPAQADERARVGGYDFAYLLGGDVAARPVQVFDDGQHTYLQFRSGAATPAIFATRAGVPQLLTPVGDGPYLRVPQLHGRLLLQLGRAQATAIHARGERADAPPLELRAAGGVHQPAATAAPGEARWLVSLPAGPARPAVEPASTRHSYAEPVHGDRIHWNDREPQEHPIAFARGSAVLSRAALLALQQIARRAGQSARFMVIGRDDDSDKEHLEQGRGNAIVAALRKAGIGAERIQQRSGPMKPASQAGTWEASVVVDHGAAEKPQPPRQQPAMIASAPQPQALSTEAPAGGFTLARSDGTVSSAVRRWALALGYQLVWDAPPEMDAPITGDASLPAGRLAQALERLLDGLRAHGYALQVTLHANRVIRFTPGSASQEPAPPVPVPHTRELAPAPAGPTLRAGVASTF